MQQGFKWHKGPPPHVGWWLANQSKNTWHWRWWNGVNWSAPIHYDASIEFVEYASRQVNTTPMNEIYWCDYYPENARVPRVNPNESEFEMEVTIKRRIFARNVWWRRALRAFWRWC